MRRRTFLRTGTAGVAAATLPRFSIAQPANARVLRFVPQANLTLLDPIITTAAVTINHGWMVWDTLFGVNAALQARPQMAEGYTVSDDGRTYLIKLREGLKWHDGEPVRAQDCAASLARWAVRDTFGQTAAKSVDAWGVADDRTVKITLKRPFPLLIDAIALQTSFIMPERLAKTDPFKAITEIGRLGSVPFPEGRVRRRQQCGVGKIRWLRATPGTAGMDLWRARSPTSSASSGRSSLIRPPRRPRYRLAKWTGMNRRRPTWCRC